MDRVFYGFERLLEWGIRGVIKLMLNIFKLVLCKINIEMVVFLFFFRIVVVRLRF